MIAVFGISNDGLNTAVQLLILFLVVIWLALIYSRTPTPGGGSVSYTHLTLPTICSV